MARNYAYPRDFLDILQKLGIDPKKDMHTCHVVRMDDGRHQYEVEYYFIGEIIESPAEKKSLDISSFNFTISDKVLYREKEFPKPVLVLDCYPIVPWVINEKELQ